MTEPTKLARVPLLLLDYAARRGISRADLTKAASLSERDIADPDSRVRMGQVLDLWAALIERAADDALGLDVGRTIAAKDLGLVGYAMSCCNNLLGALSCQSRYYRIISEAVGFEITTTDANTVLRFAGHPAVARLRHPTEALMAVIVNVARELTGEPISPLRIELPFARGCREAVYEEALGTLPKFDRPAGLLEFAQETLQLPLPAADATLRGYLTDLADITLSALQSPDRAFERRVRQTLWTMLPHGKPDLWRTAHRMGISARTLQRRLHAEGSSFSRVLENLRRDLAEQLLSNPRLAVSEVAFLLGYSEPSAFQRAFRRWRGTSPRGYKAG